VQHACELRQLKRFDQEIHRAAFDRRNRFGDTAEAGHHHRANLRITLESIIQDCHAVGVGQSQVNDESVVGEGAQPLGGIGSVTGLRRSKAVSFETGDDGLAEIDVVFDDQNGRQGALRHRLVRVQQVVAGRPLAGVPRLAFRWEGLSAGYCLVQMSSVPHVPELHSPKN
jgi:hypothetical protein